MCENIKVVLRGCKVLCCILRSITIHPPGNIDKKKHNQFLRNMIFYVFTQHLGKCQILDMGPMKDHDHDKCHNFFHGRVSTVVPKMFKIPERSSRVPEVGSTGALRRGAGAPRRVVLVLVLVASVRI